MRLRLVAYEATARQIFPRWEYFLPRLGMFCSQGGNFLLSVCLSKSRNALGEWRAEAVFRAKPQRTIKSGPFADAWRCRRRSRCGGRAAARRGGIRESGGCLRCCSLFCSFLLLYVDECFVLRGWPTQGVSRAAGGSGGEGGSGGLPPPAHSTERDYSFSTSWPSCIKGVWWPSLFQYTSKR